MWNNYPIAWNKLFPNDWIIQFLSESLEATKTGKSNGWSLKYPIWNSESVLAKIV